MIVCADKYQNTSKGQNVINTGILVNTKIHHIKSIRSLSSLLLSSLTKKLKKNWQLQIRSFLWLVTFTVGHHPIIKLHRWLLRKPYIQQIYSRTSPLRHLYCIQSKQNNFVPKKCSYINIQCFRDPCWKNGCIQVTKTIHISGSRGLNNSNSNKDTPNHNTWNMTDNQRELIPLVYS